VPMTSVRSRPVLEVRLHEPRPGVLLVRPTGALTGATAGQLADRIGRRGHRGRHVVVDVGDVAPVTPAAVAALVTAAEQARLLGVTLHLATDTGYPDALRVPAAWRAHPGRSPEAVLALLPSRPVRPVAADMPAPRVPAHGCPA